MRALSDGPWGACTPPLATQQSGQYSRGRMGTWREGRPRCTAPRRRSGGQGERLPVPSAHTGVTRSPGPPHSYRFAPSRVGGSTGRGGVGVYLWGVSAPLEAKALVEI